MRRCSLLLPFLLAFAPLYAAKAPVTLPDILAWKRIQAPIVSADGHWFAYKLAPAEGDAEVILRNLIDGTETRFGIGEQPRLDPDAPAGPIAAPARDLAFSDDCKWLALAPYPTAKEAKGLKKLRKPIQAKAVLVELSSGKKTTARPMLRIIPRRSPNISANIRLNASSLWVRVGVSLLT